MIGGEAECCGEFDLILSLFNHGPGEQMSEGVVGDSEFLLDESYYGGRRILRSTFMGVSSIILILTFDETYAASGQMFDTNIRDTTSAACDGDFFPCLGDCSELSTLEPDIFGGGRDRPRIH